MKTQTQSPLRPPLKWAGGKRWLVPHLAEIWSQYQDRRLVEPFCGGLAVALSLRPTRALLNDTNSHLIHFYQHLKDGFTQRLPALNTESNFYELRTRFNRLVRQGKESSAEAAALFYFLNRSCYNGLCRFNRSGEFNVPYGKYKKVSFLSDLSPYERAFSKWTFISRDFEKLSLRDDDFVYADPPYDVEFRQYGRLGFSWSDQVRTAEWLHLHKGPVVLSNQATKRIIDLYRGLEFDIKFLGAPRMISCDGNRTRAREVLATRNI